VQEEWKEMTMRNEGMTRRAFVREAAVTAAVRDGSAVAIGHVQTEGLAAILRRAADGWERSGVEPTPLSALAVEADGHDIVTVEGLAHDGVLDSIQQSIMDHGGVQCGFCTPGILISARALLDRNPKPSDDDIRERWLATCAAAPATSSRSKLCYKLLQISNLNFQLSNLKTNLHIEGVSASLSFYYAPCSLRYAIRNPTKKRRKMLMDQKGY
jgi:hypothetical protein